MLFKIYSNRQILTYVRVHMFKFLITLLAPLYFSMPSLADFPEKMLFTKLLS